MRRPTFVAAVALGVLLAGGARAEERVDITAMDGVQLIGELGGTSGPGLVLVPGAHRERGVWRSAATAIAARGFRTLRFDLRGQGDSTAGPEAAATDVDRDVEGAYRYLLGRKIRPVFLIGEGVGAVASLAVARRVPVAGVVVLGPSPKDAPAGIAVPTLVLTDDASALSPESLAAMVAFLNDPK